MAMYLNPASGIPLYLQLIEQVKHAIETGAMRSGDQLPSVRKMAEDLLINPNTVARAYRDLEHEGIIELKHGSGAFIRESVTSRTKLMAKAQSIVQATVDRLAAFHLTEDEIRRLVENEFALRRTAKQLGKKHA
jgi:GntR family transcriptional regulator